MINLFNGMTPAQMAEVAYAKAPTLDPQVIGQALTTAPDPRMAGMSGLGLSLGGGGLGAQVPQGPATGLKLPQVQGPADLSAMMGTGLPQGKNAGFGAYNQMLPYMMQAMGGGQPYDYGKGGGSGPMLGQTAKAPVSLQTRPPKPNAAAIGALIGGR